MGDRGTTCDLWPCNQVSEQENEKRKNDTLSWLKNEEPVNDDTDNVKEVDDDD